MFGRKKVSIPLKQGHRRFCLCKRRNIFAARLSEHGLRFPREAAETLSLETFKRFLHTALGNWLEQGVGQDCV